MDDTEESGSPVELSKSNWNRVIDAATKTGYREGIEEGKQSVFQEGFDIGYGDAFATAFILGKYKGLGTSLANHCSGTSPADDILDKTRRGACNICTMKLNSDSIELPLQQVRNEQRKHSETTIQILRRHFDVLLKDRGLCVNDFTL